MSGGLHFLPIPRRGHRRLGLLGLGLLAAISMVWQQSATVANYTDAEFSKATFTAATLAAITPDIATSAATATGSWEAGSGSWAAPNYVLTGATTSTGGNAAQVYSGSALTFAQTIGSNSTTENLTLTSISAGGTHACGIARGQLYCWGTSPGGALGPGIASPTPTPSLVTTFANKTVTDLSAGTDFTCAVADAVAYCWGNGGGGRTGLNGTGNTAMPTVVVGIPSSKTVTSISAGATHACAVADGAAYCWGNNTNGQLGNTSTTSSTSAVAVTAATGILSGRTVTAISTGTSHSCATADGMAFCWGVNAHGQLGDASITQRIAPVAVSAAGVLNGRSITGLSAGEAHTCAVADGRAYCWGLTSNGRLGNGVTAVGNQASPVAVTGTAAASANVTAISAGSTQSCAIAGGTAHCWGGGASGQLGNGTNTASAGAAVAVSTSGVLSGRTLTTISAGSLFTCTTGYTPGSCWGLGTGGQLGNKASASANTAVNTAITGPVCTTKSVRLNATDCSLEQGTEYWGRLGYSIGTWTAPNSTWVKATTTTRGAVTAAATAKTPTSLTLGWDEVSELSKSYAEYTVQRSTSPSGSNPVTIYRGGSETALDRGGFAKRTSSLAVSGVSSGADHTCAILEGAAYCWGDNTDGELGTNNTTDESIPAPVVTTGVLAGKTVSALSAGENHTCAVANGGVYCWGFNVDGRVGGTSTADKLVPVAVGTLTAATDVSSGYWHSCALVSGSVWCWGDNTRGQIGDGTISDTRTSPVKVQGLLANKTVTAISAGGAHTCALADAKMYCWGSNVSGQLGVNSLTNSSVPVAVADSGAFTNTSVTEMSSGYAHTCSVAGGKAYCWGYNAYGQLGNTTNNNARVATAVAAPWAASASLASISGGKFSTCVLAGGKAYCWGANDSGQLGNGSTNDRDTPVAVITSGGLSGTAVSQISAGTNRTCAVSEDAAYCWGSNGGGWWDDNDTQPVAIQAVAGPVCEAGAALITPAACSLTPSTNYYYKLTYTVDGGMTKSSDWITIKTT